MPSSSMQNTYFERQLRHLIRLVHVNVQSSDRKDIWPALSPKFVTLFDLPAEVVGLYAKPPTLQERPACMRPLDCVHQMNDYHDLEEQAKKLSTPSLLYLASLHLTRIGDLLRVSGRVEEAVEWLGYGSQLQSESHKLEAQKQQWEALKGILEGRSRSQGIDVDSSSESEDQGDDEEIQIVG